MKTQQYMEDYLRDEAGFDALSEAEQARLFRGAMPGEALDTATAAEADFYGMDGGSGTETVVPGRTFRQPGANGASVSAGGAAQPVPQAAPQKPDYAEIRRQMNEAYQNELANLHRALHMAMMEGEDEQAERVQMRINEVNGQRMVDIAQLQVLEAREEEAAEAQEKQRLYEAVNTLVQQYPELMQDEELGRQVMQLSQVLEMAGLTGSQALEAAGQMLMSVYRRGKMAAESEAGDEAEWPDEALQHEPQRGAGVKKAALSVEAVMPRSLSEVPAGTVGAHDEAAALRNLAPRGLISRLSNKNSDQILELMNRLV